MRSRPTPTPALAFLTLTLAALLAGWAGCAAGDSVHQTGSNTTGTTTMSGSGGATSTGGTGGSSTDGGDGGLNCSATEKVCNGACVMGDDPQYGCGQSSCTPCPAFTNAGTVCAAGLCVLGPCNGNFKNCDMIDSNGCESDTQTDPKACGACGHTCSLAHATPSCVAGVCQIVSCDAGWTDCNMDPKDGCETNLQADPMNCGMCSSPGNDHSCPGQETCTAGVCGLVCPKGKADCDMDPADVDGCETQLFTDQNCAMCGDTCNLQNSMSSCMQVGGMGVCNLNGCDPGFANCDMIANNGCEVNKQTDSSNCGSCGNKCPFGPNSTATCVNSGCVLICDPGYKDCDNNPTTGCEIHSDIDPSNCGSCGHICVTPNATPTCLGGVCQIQMCAGGYKDCNMMPGDGCEINTQTDPNNCGNCMAKCMLPNAVAGCANGACTVQSCAPGWLDCDGIAMNGCETPVGVNHCGTCMTVCSTMNGTPACNNGMCAVGSCLAGFAHCPGQPGTNCETNTNGDPSNCGMCSHVCNVPNASAACVGGICAVGMCAPGFGDCDSDPTDPDGCETNLTNNNANCGACGKTCASVCGPNVAATSCVASACGILACAQGFYNLDGQCTTGCTCAGSTSAGSCGAAQGLGSLQVGQAIAPVSSNLIPALLPGNVPNGAWYQITFNGNANTGYHPLITLSDPLGEFVMDVQANCAGTLISCVTEGGSSSGITQWEEQYTAGDPGSYPVTGSHFGPIAPVGTNGTVWVHVYRKNPNAGVTCNQYTLNASD